MSVRLKPSCRISILIIIKKVRYVTDYSRLEQFILKAVRLDNIDENAKDAMLRSKFWPGLKSSQLKNATRHINMNQLKNSIL